MTWRGRGAPPWQSWALDPSFLICRALYAIPCWYSPQSLVRLLHFLFYLLTLGVCTHTHTWACTHLVAQWWPTLCVLVDGSPPGSSVHGILQARVLEWVTMPSSRRSSPLRDWTQVSYVSCIAGGFFTFWAIWEDPSYFVVWLKLKISYSYVLTL